MTFFFPTSTRNLPAVPPIRWPSPSSSTFVQAPARRLAAADSEVPCGHGKPMVSPCWTMIFPRKWWSSWIFLGFPSWIVPSFSGDSWRFSLFSLLHFHFTWRYGAVGPPAASQVAARRWRAASLGAGHRSDPAWMGRGYLHGVVRTFPGNHGKPWENFHSFPHEICEALGNGIDARFEHGMIWDLHYQW